MKLALVGNRGHLEYVLSGLPLLPEVEIVAITSGSQDDDVNPLLAESLQTGFQPEVFTDYLALLDVVKPDVVSLCGPFEQHTGMSIEALQRSIHVFCEKPVSLNLNELEKLRNVLVGKPEVHFSAMMGLRYNPAFYTAWGLVQQGAIGKVRLLNGQKSYKLGVRPDYYRQRETYGGTIPWVGSHAIDWIHWFSQAQFLSVSAYHSTLGNRGLGTLEATALCQFKLTDDIMASVTVDYLRPSQSTTHGDDRLRVVGTEGVVEVRHGEVFLINSGGEQNPAVACERQIFVDFIHQIQGKTKSLLQPGDILSVTEACLLARQSADEGREIFFRR